MEYIIKLQVKKQRIPLWGYTTIIFFKRSFLFPFFLYITYPWKPENTTLQTTNEVYEENKETNRKYINLQVTSHRKWWSILVLPLKQKGRASFFTHSVLLSKIQDFSCSLFTFSAEAISPTSEMNKRFPCFAFLSPGLPTRSPFSNFCFNSKKKTAWSSLS